MRRLFLSAVLISLVNYVFADINGNGYYRVKNVGTARWASLIDNKGSVDKIGSRADLHAMKLTKNTEDILSDPGSVVYVENVSGYQYVVSAQGISLEDLMDNPIMIRESGSNNGQKKYRIYGTYKGAIKYISDDQIITSETYGTPTIDGNPNYPNNFEWEFIPVSETSDNYFGVVPDMNVGGKLYKVFFADFPFKPVSSAVKTYYIGRAAYGMAELFETTDVVPAGLPVIIECAGEKMSDNKLQIIDKDSEALASALKGVYFNYNGSTNVNQVAYNPNTMRILGKCSDGSLGFVKSNIDYIPANTAYLQVSNGSPAEFKLGTTQEFDENYVAGVDVIGDDSFALSYSNNAIYGDSSHVITVMNLAGAVVIQSYHGKADVSGLQKGAYVAISNGKTLKFIR